VRILDAGGPVSVTLRHGAVLSLYKSATGRAFSTFFRSPFLRDALERELTEEAHSQGIAVGTIRRQFENMLREFSGRGIARTTGSLTPGINGLSVPVFDHGGRMVAAVTALGSAGDFDVEWDSPTTKAMKETGYALSRRMGYGLAADSSGAPSSGAPGRNRTNT
jgi:DNA-binding IclR family transcriptional regulator